MEQAGPYLTEAERASLKADSKVVKKVNKPLEKAVKVAQKGVVNPFSGEEVVPSVDSDIVTEARAERIKNLMKTTNDLTGAESPIAPPAPTSASSAAMPKPSSQAGAQGLKHKRRHGPITRMRLACVQRRPNLRSACALHMLSNRAGCVQHKCSLRSAFILHTCSMRSACA